MQRKLNWLLGAALAFGGMTLLASTAYGADDTNAAANPSAAGTNVAGATDQSAAPTLPAGITVKDKQEEVKDLAKPVAEVTEAAMTKDGFDDIVERFVDQDRNRMPDSDKLNDDTLKGRIDALSKTWNEKYNQKFSIDRDKIFANAKSIEGEIQDPATVANNWPVPATAAQKALGNESARPAGATVDQETKTQGNIEKGRNVAILRLPAEQGLPALDVSLIHEVGGWKIDVPNTRTAQQIHDDLLKHLTMLGEKSGQWPANADDAYKAFTRHVLMGIYGVEASSAQGG